MEIVRSIFADWARGDYASADWADPDIEFVGADAMESKGINGLSERWGEFLEAWDHFSTLAEEILDASDDRVLALVRFRGRGRGSGTPVTDFSGANLFTFRDGKVVRLVLYTDTQEALEAAGLSE